ncbi:MAG: isochorismatase [Gemmatimonadetes bacterium]|nr:isochorismatase [Gemmatimonadota bacterium]
MHPYRPRPIRYDGVHPHAGWRLKQYEITCDPTPLNRDTFASGIELALATLPAPAVTPERPGLGFLVAHQGRNADYIVLGWWDRENELPVRIFVREEGAGWRPARGSESFCVWDLQVLWFEREAYVSTVLAEEHPEPIEAYLHLSVAGPVPAGAA